MLLPSLLAVPANEEAGIVVDTNALRTNVNDAIVRPALRRSHTSRLSNSLTLPKTSTCSPKRQAPSKQNVPHCWGFMTAVPYPLERPSRPLYPEFENPGSAGCGLLHKRSHSRAAGRAPSSGDAVGGPKGALSASPASRDSRSKIALLGGAENATEWQQETPPSPEKLC
jgi:hypothetical protein